MTHETLSALLSGIGGISILVAGYLQQVTVGYGGSPVSFRPWVKFGLYPALIVLQGSAIALLLW